MIATLFYFRDNNGKNEVRIPAVFLLHAMSSLPSKRILLWIHGLKKGDSDPLLARHLGAPSQWLLFPHAPSKCTRTHGGYLNFYSLPVLLVQSITFAWALGEEVDMKQIPFSFLPFTFPLPPVEAGWVYQVILKSG